MTNDNRKHSRRGFSIIEMVVVIAVLSSLALIGAGISAGSIGGAKVKGSAEQLLWDIRAIHQYTMARGNFQLAGGSGIKFYAARINAARNGVDTIGGFSYVVWGANPRTHNHNALERSDAAAAPPPDDLTTAGLYRSFVKNLPQGVVLKKNVGGAFVDIVNGDRLQFTPTGDLALGSIGEPAADLPVLELQAGDSRLLQITMWGERLPAGLGYQRPRSIVLQIP